MKVEVLMPVKVTALAGSVLEVTNEQYELIKAFVKIIKDVEGNKDTEESKDVEENKDTKKNKNTKKKNNKNK